MTSRRALEITADTMVPIGVIAGVAAVIWFGAGLYFQTEANSNDVTRIDTYLKERRSIGDDMRTDLATIKEKVDNVEKMQRIQLGIIRTKFR